MKDRNVRIHTQNDLVKIENNKKKRSEMQVIWDYLDRSKDEIIQHREELEKVKKEHKSLKAENTKLKKMIKELK